MKNKTYPADRQTFYKSSSQSTTATWIEINAAAFDHNVRQYKRAIGSASLSAVVKANAYGHGIELISRLAQEHPFIDQLSVATASEALLLKKIGVTKPILVLSFLDVGPESAFILCLRKQAADTDNGQRRCCRGLPVLFSAVVLQLRNSLICSISRGVVSASSSSR